MLPNWLFNKQTVRTMDSSFQGKVELGMKKGSDFTAAKVQAVTGQVVKAQERAQKQVKKLRCALEQQYQFLPSSSGDVRKLKQAGGFWCGQCCGAGGLNKRLHCWPAGACCREVPSWAKSLVMTDWVSLACMAPIIAGLVVYVVYLWEVGCLGGCFIFDTIQSLPPPRSAHPLLAPSALHAALPSQRAEGKVAARGSGEKFALHDAEQNLLRPTRAQSRNQH